MTATAGLLLLNNVMPLITAALVKGAVQSVGSEDLEELQSEGTALAAAILDSAEAKGKTVTAGNIAYYAIQGLKCGRRSYAGRRDVMCPAAVLDGAVSVKSMDEGIGFADDGSGREMTLHDTLASDGDDTDAAAMRRLDWDTVLPHLDERRQTVLRESTEGYGANEIAAHLGITTPRVVQLRQSCGDRIVDAWGSNGLQAVTTPSRWRAGLRAGTERRACRLERNAALRAA